MFTKEIIETAVRQAYENEYLILKVQRKTRRWDVKIEDVSTIQFKQLSRLSEILGTDYIDVDNWKERRGYCETCAYTATGITLQIYDTAPA